MKSGSKPLAAATVLIFLINVSGEDTQDCKQETEYANEGQCCRLCEAGQYLIRECKLQGSTSCRQCDSGTFTPDYNRRRECRPCTSCASGSGLKINSRCTTISDTVCEALEGFYCTNLTGSHCVRAQSHSRCEPGQYIKRTGTARADTECSQCSDGTFSDGTSTSCQPRTQPSDPQPITPGIVPTAAIGGKGKHVKTDCTEASGRGECRPCTSCASGSGLKINSWCTTISDTVCEALEGFYCTNLNGSHCVRAQSHSRCEPGQYIKQKGNKLTDTVCSQCSDGTFSDGTSTSCQPRTQSSKEGSKATTSVIIIVLLNYFVF